MCTVSFVPLKGYDYVLTSNRDEAVSRSEVAFPIHKEINGHQVTFPQDGLAGGTWIATSGELTACLLNGAFIKHERHVPYKLSRGIMLLAAFEYTTAEEFTKHFDFKGIEPFTLILVYKRISLDLFEIRWDGERIFFKELLSHKPYIWASSTLYSSDTINERIELFNEFMSRFDYKQDSIINFHHFEGGDKENTIMMDRGDLKTISITSILSSEFASITYNDLVKGSTQTLELKNESSKV